MAWRSETLDTVPFAFAGFAGVCFLKREAEKRFPAAFAAGQLRCSSTLVAIPFAFVGVHFLNCEVGEEIPSSKGCWPAALLVKVFWLAIAALMGGVF